MVETEGLYVFQVSPLDFNFDGGTGGSAERSDAVEAGGGKVGQCRRG